MEINTSEIGIAACLMAKKATLNGLDKSESGSIIFKFSADEELKDIIQDYWNHRLTDIDPLTFYSNFKILKGMIYQARIP